MQTLQETLHTMIDLLPWREESHKLAAHNSVEDHFELHPIPSLSDVEEAEDNV